MKLLKIILPGLVLLAVALFGVAYQMPLQIEVEQSAELNANPEKVFALLENPMEWEKWSALNKASDPSMIRMFGGPVAGVGARMQWSGDKVGKGDVVLIQSDKPKLLLYKQNDSSYEAVAEGQFLLEPTASGGTLLSWKQTAQVKDEPVARLVAVWHKYKKQNEAVKSINRLKEFLQSAGSPPSARKPVARAF